MMMRMRKSRRNSVDYVDVVEIRIATFEAKSTEFYETNASTALPSSRRVTKGVDETTAAVGGRNFNGEG